MRRSRSSAPCEPEDGGGRCRDLTGTIAERRANALSLSLSGLRGPATCVCLSVCVLCLFCATSVLVCCSLSVVALLQTGSGRATGRRRRESARTSAGESAGAQPPGDASVAERPRTPPVHWEPVLRPQGGRHPQHVCAVRFDPVDRLVTRAGVRACVQVKRVERVLCERRTSTVVALTAATIARPCLL